MKNIPKTYILSGGKSSRMGEDKGLININEKPLISYLLDSLKKLDIKPNIITQNIRYNDFGMKNISDIITEKGPLGGIYTALKNEQNDVLVLSVDTPFYNADKIVSLLQNHKKGHISTATSNGEILPLFAIYPYEILPDLKKYISLNQLKLMSFVKNNVVNKVEMDFSELELLNLNTPGDLLLAKEIIKNGN